MQSIFLANDHSLQIQKNGIDTLNGVCINGNMPAKILLSGQGWEKEVLSYWSLNPSLTFAQLSTMNEIIKAVKYGSGVTLTSVIAKLSTVDGTAFVSNPTFTYTGLPSNDLSWLDGTGWKVNFNDGSKNAYLYAKAKGTGETLDDELLDNSSFTGTWSSNVPQNWSLSGTQNGTKYLEADDAGDRIRIVSGDGSLMGINKAGMVAGKGIPSGALLKGSIVVDSITGSLRFSGGTRWDNFPLPSITTSGTKTGYGVLPAGAQDMFYIIRVFSSNVDAWVSETSLKQVLTPSASGLTGTSTAGGATYNWASIEADFNPNVASFSVTITRA